MSSEFAIRVEHLSKSYHIYEKPRDRLLQMFLRNRKHLYREFWALKDISFAVRKGECLGVIGRNGSGKSTLLQLICGTVNPTGGSVNFEGRVAALLELGSGFNPEFTGRENVYMNASLYGLSNKEIEERFDSIVEFADIGMFIDQPVKTYSSGMVVRLAFAVIAHVDADILIVDEALAVGDAVFIQKCMRFIRTFKENNTLIFVSHDMGAVQNLCDRVLWLDQGSNVKLGPTKEVLNDYAEFNYKKISGDNAKIVSKRQPKENAKTKKISKHKSEMIVQDNVQLADGFGTGLVHIEEVVLANCDGKGDSLAFNGGELVKLCITARTSIALSSPIIGFIVRDRLGQDLFGENTLVFTDENGQVCAEENGLLQAEFIFKLPMLPVGTYVVSAAIAEGTQLNHVQHEWLHDALFFEVITSSVTRGLAGVEIIDLNLRVAHDYEKTFVSDLSNKDLVSNA